MTKDAIIATSPCNITVSLFTSPTTSYSSIFYLISQIIMKYLIKENGKEGRSLIMKIERSL